MNDRVTKAIRVIEHDTPSQLRLIRLNTRTQALRTHPEKACSTVAKYLCVTAQKSRAHRPEMVNQNTGVWSSSPIIQSEWKCRLRELELTKRKLNPGRTALSRSAYFQTQRMDNSLSPMRNFNYKGKKTPKHKSLTSQFTRHQL